MGRRYTRKWDAVVAIRESGGVPQAWLSQRLISLTEQLRAGLPHERLAVLQLRDLGEQLVSEGRIVRCQVEE